MRVAAFKQAGQPLVLEERPEPEPAPNQVLLKIHRCGICGTDLHMTSGHGALQAAPNSVLGHEFSGEVVAVGRDAQMLKVGDRVTAMASVGCGFCQTCKAGQPKWCASRYFSVGGYGQYMTTGETACVKLKNNLSWEDGALVEPLAVGLHGVEVAKMAVGARVLIVGAGPIAMAVLYWARFGAGRIVMTASSRRREAMAKTLGVDAFCLTDEEIKDYLDGPPDVVFECAGVEGAIARAIDLVKPLGDVVVLGLCAAPDTIMPMAALVKEARIHFAFLYGTADFEASIDALDSGAVEPRALVTLRIGLGELPRVFEEMRGPHSHTKVIVDPWA